MKEFYESNSKFRDYVDKYSRDHRITVEEALTHAMVRQVYLYYGGSEHDT